MIGWEYPPHNSGGLGVACDGLTRSLAAQGEQIAFTLPYKHPLLYNHMQVIGCPDPWGETGPGITTPPFLAYSTSTSSPVISAARFEKENLSAMPQSELEARVDLYAQKVHDVATERQSFDIIHAHDWMSFPAAIEVKNETGRPLVAHMHSSEFDRIPNGHGSPYIQRMDYEGMLAADRVIAVSYYTKQLLVKKYGIHPDKIDVVHNGITPVMDGKIEATQFAKGRPVVVFMGRLTAQKGAQFFLALAKEVLSLVPETLFVLAGNGDMYHELLFSTAHQGLSASVLFSGFIRDTQKNKLLDRADVFVMPSLSEPFGLVALEAAQRQTPVIISKTSGVAEVLPSSIAIDFWDVDQMRDSIVLLLKNRNQAQTQVRQQLQDINNTSWENAATKVKEVYRKAFLGS